MTMVSMAQTACPPKLCDNNGATTRKPLPMMEARGVTVAWQMREFLIPGVNNSNNVIAVIIMTAAVVSIRAGSVV